MEIEMEYLTQVISVFIPLAHDVLKKVRQHNSSLLLLWRVTKQDRGER
jgi:hypothetical protein